MMKRTLIPPACSFNRTGSPNTVVLVSGPALCPFSAPNLWSFVENSQCPF
jgi:hypothetical protein